MQLDEAQRNKVSAWVAEGAKLSEIQTRLASELGVTMTYMEARFLVDDLKLRLKDPEPPKATPTIGTDPKAAAPSPVPPAAPVPSPLAPGAAPAAGGVSVSMDQIARPGAIVSGKVTFSDGQGAEWYLDQTGRLGVIPKVTGYKPSPTDVQEFQLVLQGELAKLGF